MGGIARRFDRNPGHIEAARQAAVDYQFPKCRQHDLPAEVAENVRHVGV
jgi:hypothetical protein